MRWRGNWQNSVYEVSSPAKLLDIRKITVEADTIGGHVADAGKLTRLIDRFRAEPDGWRDDVLIAEMIDFGQEDRRCDAGADFLASDDVSSNPRSGRRILAGCIFSATPNCLR